MRVLRIPICAIALVGLLAIASVSDACPNAAFGPNAFRGTVPPCVPGVQGVQSNFRASSFQYNAGAVDPCLTGNCQPVAPNMLNFNAAPYAGGSCGNNAAVRFNATPFAGAGYNAGYGGGFVNNALNVRFANGHIRTRFLNGRLIREHFLNGRFVPLLDPGIGVDPYAGIGVNPLFGFRTGIGHHGFNGHVNGHHRH